VQERRRKESVPYNIGVSGFDRDSIGTSARDEASGPHRRLGLTSEMADNVIISFLATLPMMMRQWPKRVLNIIFFSNHSIGSQTSTAE
jgi:hypothetical protein